METAETKARRIIVVTADTVEDTGIVSFKFIFDADLYKRCGRPPNCFGWVWQTNNNGAFPGPSYCVNVWENGHLNIGGGWDYIAKSDEEKEREKKIHRDLNDALPSCCLLMTSKIFEWWKGHAKEYEIVYEHIHHEGSLRTN